MHKDYITLLKDYEEDLHLLDERRIQAFDCYLRSSTFANQTVYAMANLAHLDALCHPERWGLDPRGDKQDS